jgi:hypothetical protein
MSFAVPTVLPTQFRELHDGYVRAREQRRGGALYPLSDIRASVTTLIGDASPRSRVRRLFHQVGAEQAAICGHLEGALDFVREAVDAGLLDLAWMNRLSLLDPLRDDARFGELRHAVEERGARVREAWLGPPEPVEHALASLA